jgi:rhamnosyltransferase
MIFSIIVVYNPDFNVIERINKISINSDKVFVVVNQQDLLRKSDLKNDNIELVIIGKNIGLAKALNVGIRMCLQFKNCNHIALFDQDSLLLNDNSLFRICNLFKKNFTEKVGLIGHETIEVKLNTNPIKCNLELTEVEDNLTSGSIIPKEVFEEVGLMDENLFIDYIDYEWCLRAKSFGYKIFVTKKEFILHNLGDSFISIGKNKKPIHKNPLRVYYIIRNNLILLNRPYISLRWKYTHFIKLIYRIPGYIILSKNKINTIKKIISAVYDFWINRKSFKNYKY